MGTWNFAALPIQSIFFIVFEWFHGDDAGDHDDDEMMMMMMMRMRMINPETMIDANLCV